MTVQNNSIQVLCSLAWKCDAFGFSVCFGGGSWYFYFVSLVQEILAISQLRSPQCLAQRKKEVTQTKALGALSSQLSENIHSPSFTLLPRHHHHPCLSGITITCQATEWPVRTSSPTKQTHQGPSTILSVIRKSQSTETGIYAYGTHHGSKEHSPSISKAVSDHHGDDSPSSTYGLSLPRHLDHQYHSKNSCFSRSHPLPSSYLLLFAKIKINGGKKIWSSLSHLLMVTSLPVIENLASCQDSFMSQVTSKYFSCLMASSLPQFKNLCLCLHLHLQLYIYVYIYNYVSMSTSMTMWLEK